VSVRRSGGRPSRVPDADLETVRRELARYPRLRRYAADVRKDEIVVCEPASSPSLLPRPDVDRLTVFGVLDPHGQVPRLQRPEGQAAVQRPRGADLPALLWRDP